MSSAPALGAEVVAWLLDGDVSIQVQVHRDLYGRDRPDLQRRIAAEGWGARYLAARNADGTWGRGFYRPKWTCTHYTLLDLAAFGVHPDTPGIREEIVRIARDERGADGGINPAGSVARSDVCINGMFLTYACHFLVPEERLTTVVDFVLGQAMDDGGFNCRRNRSGSSTPRAGSTAAWTPSRPPTSRGTSGWRTRWRCSWPSGVGTGAGTSARRIRARCTWRSSAPARRAAGSR